MKPPTIIELFVINPLREQWFRFRIAMMISILRDHGMDWGNYPIEEMYKLYTKYQHEIDLT